ncbi:MAG: heme biosynthesis HemY N-terminal domain-containing protein [Minwuia sp.]|nr:heme biosynthesis HemY N-terminal domain-containing protein [Minwuia sp.]
MIRFIILFAFVILVAVGAAWLADHPGSIALAWAGWRIETSIPVLVLLLLVLMGASALIYRLWLWLVGSPGRIGSALRGNRKEKGYKALTEGMAAIAAGEAQVASRAAEQAEKLLNGPPMAQLLRAQAAQLAGDDKTAEKYFRAMLDTKETELVALRGLLIQAGRLGDHEQALALAMRARNLRPGAGWAVRSLFDLQVSAEDWTAASQTVAGGQRAGVYTRENAGHKLAVLYTADALAKEAAGERREALTHATDALKQDPAHVPAAVLEARLLAASGKERKANRHLTSAWQQTRHPAIAEAFLALKPGESPAARLTRFETLHKSTPGDEESLLVLARLALEADDLMKANEAAQRAIDKAETIDQRHCRLMVNLAERSGDGAGKAREWLMRLADAPAAPHWQCDSCGETPADWHPRCPRCNTFDSLSWRSVQPSADTVLLVDEVKQDAGTPEEVPVETVAR